LGKYDWIRKYRKKAGLTQKQLAENLGVSQPEISFWETGVIEPSDDSVQRISAILDADERTLGITPPIGEWVHEKREEKGLSRAELAQSRYQ